MSNKNSLVKVRYFGPISFTLGKKEEMININSSSIELAKLIEVLVNKYGQELEDIIFEEDSQLNQHITVYINNQKINDTKDKVCQGDEVYFFIALTGG